jgi:hypothetical protein
MNVPLDLIKDSVSCLHNILSGVYQSQKMKTIPLRIIIWPGSITQTNIIYFATQNEYLNIILIKKLEFDLGTARMRLMAHRVLLRQVTLLVLLFSLSLLFYKFSIAHFHLQVFHTKSTHGRSLDKFPKSNSLSKIPKFLIDTFNQSAVSIPLQQDRMYRITKSWTQTTGV